MADGMTELFEESGAGYTVSHCLDQGLPVRLAAAQFVDADAAGGQIHFQADQSVRPQRIDQPTVPQALCPALEELDKIRVVDVVLPTRLGPEICRRCVSQPTDHQAILLQRLGLHLPKNLPLAGQFLKKM